MTHTRAKIKVEGQAVQMIEWKRTDGHDRLRYLAS